MNKRIVSFLAAVHIFMGMAAQTVSVKDVEVLAAGETVSFYVHYADVNAMTSTHFEMQLPTGCSIVNVEATNNWTAMYSNDGGVVGAISTTANAFSGEGDIAKVTMTVTAKEEGSYPIGISNIRINGTTLDATATFNVVVVSAHTVVLDENSTTAPEAAEGVNARVLRTISADIWSTICLPFAMTAEQVKAAFGDDVQIADFKSWEATDWDDDDNTTAIQVKFTDVSTIEANRPYIIKVSQPITEFTVDGVDIDAEDEPSVTVGRMNRGTFGSFTGTYVPITIEEECLFLNSSKFWYSTGSSTMKGFRAYFWFQDVIADYTSEAGSGARISFSFDDATGINASLRSNGQSNADVYNLQGQRVTKPGKGLFIKNGKKVIVK